LSRTPRSRCKFGRSAWPPRAQIDSKPKNPQDSNGFGQDILDEIVKDNPAENLPTIYKKFKPPKIENLYDDF